jgi:hypothetical protein
MNWTPSSLVDKLRHITHLRGWIQQFYPIFALNDNNFGKIILILPPAKPADIFDAINNF